MLSSIGVQTEFTLLTNGDVKHDSTSSAARIVVPRQHRGISYLLYSQLSPMLSDTHAVSDAK